MIVDRSEVFSKTHACFVWVSRVFPKSSFNEKKESCEGETETCLSVCRLKMSDIRGLRGTDAERRKSVIQVQSN